jgi:hypothetical protein
MKKTLLILLLSVAAFTVKAQNMSFEETVKYISDKLAVCRFPTTFAAEKDGTITVDRKAYNLFDLYQDPIEDKFNIKQDKGIVYRVTPTGGNYIQLITSSKGDPKIIAFFTVEKDEERVYNALIYLRSLCSKSKDPFDK